MPRRAASPAQAAIKPPPEEAGTASARFFAWADQMLSR
jgi:hypothetical protein